MFRNREPRFIENSPLPRWLSKIAPIQIGAISLGFWVFARGTVSKTERRHETIHFQQQLEMFFMPMLVLYGLYFLVGLAKYRDGKKAYRQIPFEQEAYDNQRKPTYLTKRKRFAWIKYKI